MLNAVYVGLGGCVGAILRYWSGEACSRLLPATFPCSTLLINVLGSLLIGFISQACLCWGARLGSEEALRLFLITGLLGGFTTWSSFALDYTRMLSQGTAEQYCQAAAYISGHLLLSLAACALGLWLGRIYLR